MTPQPWLRDRPPPPGAAVRWATLAERYAAVRAQTLALVEPLGEADCQAQSMPDASPAKWHLAHVTWFFETFVLEPNEPGFEPHHPAYRVLFNSYYNGIGQQHPRPQRGLVTRPTLAEVVDYRRAVDERVLALLAAAAAAGGEGAAASAMAATVELGLHHEQQHQELLLTDLLHLFSCNPLAPVYRAPWPLAAVAPLAPAWVPFDGGLVEIGHDAGARGAGFAFDNESPRHRQWLAPHALANRLTTNGEWAAFIADGGYRDPRWWLAAGWDWVNAQRIEAPLYWRRGGGDAADGRATGGGDGWQAFTLHGLVPVDPHTPVTHVSLYEADAYARWAAAQQRLPVRLPTEAEWEHAAAALGPSALAAGNFVETQALHPLPVHSSLSRPAGELPSSLSRPAGEGRGEGAALATAPASHPALRQMYGDCWEWTCSAYLPYPGFRAAEGAVGEYNGKFMVDQTVLRGGSCATPRSHIRASYRNFFPASARWQFSGVRLACDA